MADLHEMRVWGKPGGLGTGMILEASGCRVTVFEFASVHKLPAKRSTHPALIVGSCGGGKLS